MRYRFPVITRGIPPKGRNEQTLVTLRTLDVDVLGLSDAEAPVALVVDERRHEGFEKYPLRHHEGRFFVKEDMSPGDFEADAFGAPFAHEGPRAELFETLRWQANSLPPWPTTFADFVRKDLSAKPDAAAMADFMEKARKPVEREGLSARFEDLALAGLRKYAFIEGEVWRAIGEPVYAVSLLDDTSGDDVEFELSFENHFFGGGEGRHYFSLADRQSAIDMIREHKEEFREGQIDAEFPLVEIRMPETLAKDGDLLTFLAMASHVAKSTYLPEGSKKREAALDTCRALVAAVEAAGNGGLPPEDVETALDIHIATCKATGMDITMSNVAMEAVLARWNGRSMSVEAVPVHSPRR